MPSLKGIGPFKQSQIFDSEVTEIVDWIEGYINPPPRAQTELYCCFLDKKTLEPIHKLKITEEGKGTYKPSLKVSLEPALTSS